VNLNRWDIIFVPADDKDVVGHPAVVLSPPDILSDPKQNRINVLVGTKKQPAETAKSHQVILNGADGLEFMALLNCALVYQVKDRCVEVVRSGESCATRCHCSAVARGVRAGMIRIATLSRPDAPTAEVAA
jgi:hypothetical protein